MTMNPHRVTIYLPPDRLDKARRLAEQLTASGVRELFDKNGKLFHSRLYLWLIDDKLGVTESDDAQ